MTAEKIGLSIILSFCCTMSFTQDSKIDSLKKAAAGSGQDAKKVYTLIELCGAYRFSHADTALVYAKQALALAERLHDDDAIFWSITAVGGTLYVLGNYSLELDYANRLQVLSEKLNTPYTTGYAYGLLSDSYYNLGDYTMSLRYWREVVKIGETKLPGELFRMYGNSSHIFAGMGEYDSALIYGRKSYGLFLSDSLYARNNNETKFIQSALFVAIGDAYSGKGNTDSALHYYKASIPLSQLSGNGLSAMDACNGLARLYKGMDRIDSAICWVKKAMAEKIAVTYPKGMLLSAGLLADLYKNKNTDSSLKYLVIASVLKDSLYNREKTMAFQSLLFKEQERKKETAAVARAIQNRWRIYFAVFLLLIALVITRNIIRNRRLRQLQEVRNRIADDLHDDIGSALSSISIMNELAKQKAPEALSLLNAIGENAATIQENMGDIIWTIKSGNDSFGNVLQKMKQFASEILESKNMLLVFKAGGIDPVLSMQHRKNFYLFFKEVINNAAKHSQASGVSVDIACRDKTVYMDIVDNGKGFDTSINAEGNGMSSLRQRAAELKANFNIVSQPGNGTSVQLIFKTG